MRKRYKHAKNAKNIKYQSESPKSSQVFTICPDTERVKTVRHFKLTVHILDGPPIGCLNVERCSHWLSNFQITQPIKSNVF